MNKEVHVVASKEAPLKSAVQAPKVVVFDLGKVLLDFDYSIACRRFAEKSRVSPEEAHHLLHNTTLLYNFETGQLTSRQFYERMQEGSGFFGDEREFQTIFQEIFTPIPEMISLHATLRAQGIPTFIFSNTNDIAIEYIRERFSFFSLFDNYVLSYQHGAMKPQPKLYEVVEKTVGCRGAKILYIDDRPENIEAGARRGWQVILQEHPDRTLDQVKARGLLA
ncbi:MAG: HAD family phosphatase [Verrucomicrobia bacterium]|nr:HAD family phosphatase [Verrucomicrobiota bacterium]